MRRALAWLFPALVVLIYATSTGTCMAEEENRYASLKRFSQVLDIVESHYVHETPRKDLIDGAITGMIQQLDPHSTYMSKDEFKEMQVSTSGEFGGIGIEISLEQGQLVVVSPIEDTPAYKAGLKAGDIILEIEGKITQDMSLVEAVKKIRGPKGSSVNLTVLHKASKSPEKVTLVRENIPIVSVKTQEFEPGYLYLRLTRFNENTTRDMRDALAKAGGKGKLKGIVLDLRNNPGGLLDQAVSVTDAFLDKGLIVYIQGRDASMRKDYNASKEQSDVTDMPIVTLINAGSASASEIVAGALQDHKRSLILGEKSFGKGSVQTLIPLSDGSGIKLTTALYYTPSGRSIQAQGIEPDILVPFEAPREDEDKDKDKATSLRQSILREKDLSRHLENGNKPGKDQKKDPQASEDSTKIEEMLKKDNQLRMGLQMVKSLPKLKQIQ